MRKKLTAVTISGREVFGQLVPTKDGFRLRLLTAEWVGLNLAAGQTVDVTGLGPMLLSEVVAIKTGGTWVTFTKPVRG